MFLLKGLILSLLTSLPASEGFFKPWRRFFNMKSYTHEKTYPNALYSSNNEGDNYIHTPPDNYLVSTSHSHYESDDCNCSNDPFRPIQEPHFSEYTPILNSHLAPPPEEYSITSPVNNPSQHLPMYYVGNPEPISTNAFRPMLNTQVKTSNIVPAIQIPNSFQTNVNEMTRVISSEPTTSGHSHIQPQLSQLLTPPHVNYQLVPSTSQPNYPTDNYVTFPGSVNQAQPVLTIQSDNGLNENNLGLSNGYSDFNSIGGPANPATAILSPADKEVVQNLIYGNKYSPNQYSSNSIGPHESTELYQPIGNPVYIKGSYKKPSLKDYSGEYSQIFDEESPVDIKLSETGKVIQYSSPSTTKSPEYKVKPAVVAPTSFPTSDSSTGLIRDHLLMPTLIRVIETVYRNHNGIQNSL